MDRETWLQSDLSGMSDLFSDQSDRLSPDHIGCAPALGR